jgi:hypothetical protein
VTNPGVTNNNTDARSERIRHTMWAAKRVVGSQSHCDFKLCANFAESATRDTIAQLTRCRKVRLYDGAVAGPASVARI